MSLVMPMWREPELELKVDGVLAGWLPLQTNAISKPSPSGGHQSRHLLVCPGNIGRLLAREDQAVVTVLQGRNMILQYLLDVVR